MTEFIFRELVNIGASKGAQLQEYVSLIRKASLQSPIVALVKDLWAAVQSTRGSVFLSRISNRSFRLLSGCITSLYS